MGTNPSSSENLLRIAGNYSLPHKYLVQLIIKRGILQAHYFCNKFVQYVQIYDFNGSTITQPVDEQEKILIQKLVMVINNAITLLNLRLIQTDDEYDDTNSYIVLLSDRRPNDLLRDAFGFTQAEVTLFHLWVNAICHSEDNEISKHEAFSIASDLLRKGKRINEECLLEQCISNKWLLMDNEKATIRLDTRGIAELQTYFNSHSDELKFKKCFLCGKFIVVKNRAISCKTCESFFHRQCGLKIIKSVKTGTVLCPGKLANNEACIAELHIPAIVTEVRQNQKGSHEHISF